MAEPSAPLPSPILPPTPLQTPTPTSTPLSKSAHLQTKVHKASDILKNANLAAKLSTFINEGYNNATVYSADKWDATPVRFHSPSEIHETLGQNGLVAAIYNGEDPVACACCSPWHGDMDGVMLSGEDEAGWEIKAVTTKTGWGKMGLAGRCIAALTEDLVKQEKAKGRNGAEKVKLWLHTVEEVNGEYWRRRGWKDVRSFERPVGYWGSKHGFRLLVAVKEIGVATGEAL